MSNGKYQFIISRAYMNPASHTIYGKRILWNSLIADQGTTSILFIKSIFCIVGLDAFYYSLYPESIAVECGESGLRVALKETCITGRASLKQFLKTIDDPAISRALGFSAIDGILWALMFGLAENYIVPFTLFFGASALHISIMQGSMQFGIAMAQITGASFIERFRKRKRLSLFCNIIHALSFIGVCYGAIITRSPWTIIIAFTLGAFVNNIAGPGWLSWMNDIVPGTVRGAFWSNRNRLITITQFLSIIIAGMVLFFGKNKGFELPVYMVLFTTAAISRLTASTSIGGTATSWTGLPWM